MAELKKCPFCGGEARKATDYSPAGYQVKYIACKECGCRTKPHDMSTENRILIDEWNNRATESEIRAKAIFEFAEWIKSEFKTEIQCSDEELTWIDEAAEQLKEE